MTDTFDDYYMLFDDYSSLETALAMGLLASVSKKEKAELDLARALAKWAHHGQLDKGGNDYFEHVEYVATHVTSTKEQTVAYLHDIIEDTSITIEMLKPLFAPDVVTAVDLLTRRGHIGYYTYIQTLKKNPLAVAVKLADLQHNMDISRLKEVKPRDVERKRKYEKATEILQQALLDK